MDGNVTTSKKKAVLVISSHVVRGAVGNRAAVFALETLGYPVWAVNTIMLAWHPGHGAARRIVPDHQSFCDLIDNLAHAPFRAELAGILTGYLGDAKQAEPIARLIAGLKAENPDLFYVCDPVIGDQGGLYVSEETADAIRDKLLPLADLITPNRFELEYLANGTITESGPDTAHQCLEVARGLNVPQVLVTSVPGLMKNHIGNLLVEENVALMAEHLFIDNPPNGLGDLTAALFLANHLSGHGNESVLARITASVFEVLADMAKGGGNELALIENAASLLRPMAMVTTRSLGAASTVAGKKAGRMQPKVALKEGLI